MMTRTAGVGVPRDKRVVASLTYTYGVDNTTTKEVLANVSVSEDVHVRDLADGQTGVIRAEIDKLKVEGDLRREANLDIRRLMKVDSYHGIRHCRGLPTREQNTKNSTRTRKGPAETVADKKKQFLSEGG